MKEELQGKLVEILTSIQTAAGKASDFALAELPDIAQSYVSYGRAWASLDAVLWLLVIPAFFWFIGRRVDRMFRQNDASYPAGLFLGVGGVVSGITLMVGLGGLQKLMLVWFAPKVWLLKEIATLLK
jgi:hypothetical protein